MSPCGVVLFLNFGRKALLHHPFVLDPSDVGLQLFGREQASHTGDKPGQLSRKLRPAGGCLGEIQQFLGNHIIECRLRPVAQPDVLGDLALLRPDFAELMGAHVIPPIHRCRGASASRREAPMATQTTIITVARTRFCEIAGMNAVAGRAVERVEAHFLGL